MVQLPPQNIPPKIMFLSVSNIFENDVKSDPQKLSSFLCIGFITASIWEYTPKHHFGALMKGQLASKTAFYYICKLLP